MPMIGFPALAVNIFLVLIACFVSAVGLDEYRKRRTRSTRVMFLVVATLATGLTLRFGVYMYNYVWLRTIEPGEVESIVFGDVEVVDVEARNSIVHALNQCQLYYRNHGLGVRRSLVLTLRSNRRVTLQVFYDGQNEGAAIYFRSGTGFNFNFGEVFSAPLVQAASQAGILLEGEP